jgi:quinol monooxygenase YgiN
MIVRVLNARIAPNRGAEFQAFVREHGLPRLQNHPGLVSLHVGRRNEGPDEFVTVISVWRNWDALQDALGPDPSQPYLPAPGEGMVVSTSVEHFEAVEISPLASQLGSPAAEPQHIRGPASPATS